jgi:hypothetical protein
MIDQIIMCRLGQNDKKMKKEIQVILIIQKLHYKMVIVKVAYNNKLKKS